MSSQLNLSYVVLETEISISSCMTTSLNYINSRRQLHGCPHSLALTLACTRQQAVVHAKHPPDAQEAENKAERAVVALGRKRPKDQ